MQSKIRTIRATKVIVPPKPNSINSANIEECDKNFAQKFLTGNSWSDFAIQPKWIIEIELQNGMIGIGETYRSAPEFAIREAVAILVEKDILKLNWKNLPIKDQRVYESFETAILDLVGQLLNVPVYQLLGGGYRTEIECMGWTGRRTPEEAASKAFESMSKGHRVFKFKCADDDSISDWFDHIHAVCKNEIKILLDPNQRWKDVETTLRLMKNVPSEMMFGLEDPIAHHDIKGYRFLKEQFSFPIYRHISLPYHQEMSDIVGFIKADAADGYNFNGSAYQCILLSEISNLEGKSCWRGSEVDLGISETMGLHIAAASINCTLPADIFGELVRENDLINQPILIENGRAAVPQLPGLGVTLDYAALEKYAIQKMVI